MTQETPISPQPAQVRPTFRWVQENWNDLGRIERVGFAGLIVLIAQKNHVERSIKKQLFSFLRRH